MFDAAAAEAERLGYIGAAVHDVAAADAFPDAAADELDARAVQLRGHALHAAVMVMQLAAQAGKLEGLANVRRLAAASHPDEDREG